MTLNELLKTEEAKKMYKELSKKYHPDLNGDPEIMKRINKAKDEGDEKLKKLYDELKGIKPQVKNVNKNQIEKIRRWMSEIKLPGMIHYITRKNDDGSIYINIFRVDGSDFVILDGAKIKTKDNLRNKIIEKL